MSITISMLNLAKNVLWLCGAFNLATFVCATQHNIAHPKSIFLKVV